MGKHEALDHKPKPKVAGRPGRWLPVLAVVVSLVVLVGGLWWSQSRTKTSFVPQVIGRPHASIDQTTFDYGDVKLGATIQTVFRVKNTGDQALALLGDPQVEVVEGC